MLSLDPLDRAGAFVSRGLEALERRGRSFAPFLFGDQPALELRIVGRMLFHATLVGVAAGLIGTALFFGLEWVQGFLLEDLAGYDVLRAKGESFAPTAGVGPFRPWLLLALPALGGLAAGVVSRWAPETRGGGADTTIAAFHHRGGVVRRRVIWIKAAASVFTLGTGGSGGREGPTMQIGGALGSAMGRLLDVSTRERRILLVAGIAAGISAVFKTPLGAAILAVEILYRDGFESDALIPSVFASVISYSVAISISGEATLFATPGHFPFVPAHLPLYALLAVLVAALAALFLVVFRGAGGAFARLPLPGWARPAVGGLALGLLCTPVVMFVGERIGQPGHGLGLFGGGYGAVQMAITGADWLPGGWQAVLLLAGLCLAKIVATSITVGSGGSAGDFAPSLAIGALFGGAFGRAAQIVLADPRIDPGAFALVGMGVFYGGLAHVPLSAVILVCELAGNYDLLVPLMLAQGIAFVALRKRSLYQAQVPTLRDSPVHRAGTGPDVLSGVRVRDVARRDRPVTTLRADEPYAEMRERASAAKEQEVFPVIGADGALAGLVTWSAIDSLANARDEARRAKARDLMQPPISIGLDDDLRTATERLVANHLREVPIADDDGRVTGLFDENDVATAYVQAAARAGTPRESDP